MNPIEFELTYAIPAPTGPGDERIRLAEARLDDLVIATHAGLATATVTTVGPDAVTAGLRAAAVLADSDLPPLRTCPDLVSLADAEDRARIAAGVFTAWAAGNTAGNDRADRFPAPALLAGEPLWLWGDIVSWLRARGISVDDTLNYPSLVDHTRIDAQLMSGHD